MSEEFIIIIVIICYRRSNSPINTMTFGGDSEQNLLTTEDDQ